MTGDGDFFKLKGRAALKELRKSRGPVRHSRFCFAVREATALLRRTVWSQ